MHIGRDFKREIKLNKLTKIKGNLRPNRSWIDLFSLFLLVDTYLYEFDITNLIKILNTDEVIIIDSHDDIFKADQIHYWSKDRISDILPAIKCPSFKSETKMFKISEMEEIGKFIYDQNHIKSIVIENADEELSISLVYGDTVKITWFTFYEDQHINFFDKLKERYELWKIEDCVCKPKKIRFWENDIECFKNEIKELEKISNINDAKLGMIMRYEYSGKHSSNYDTIIFNDSVKLRKDKSSYFIFTGDSLTVVFEGDYYNFRLDQKIKEFKYSRIIGKNIINSNSKKYFALCADEIFCLRLILTDKEVKNSENKDFIENLKRISTQEERYFIVFDKNDITLKSNIDATKIKIPEHEFYSKVDSEINDEVKPKDIIKLLKNIPSHLELRLEADNIEQIIRLMKIKILIEKMKKQGIKFLHKGIEIQPRIIKSKMDEEDFKNDVKEIEAKRDRLNMDCDEVKKILEMNYGLIMDLMNI